jgi:hypothetical protein
MVPKMMKNSEFVLVPGLIKGTHLEKLNDIMLRNGINQFNFKTVSKVGNIAISNIFTNKGQLIEKDIDKEILKSKEQLYYRNLYTQLDIVSHIKDTENKLGSRVHYKITDNIIEGAVGELNAARVAIVDKCRIAKIKRHAERLDKEIKNKDGKLNYEAVSKFLYDDIIRNGNSNDVNAIKIDPVTGLFNLPLDFPIHRAKVMSKLLSMFNNNINTLKLPGIHGPQASNILMDRLKGSKMESSSVYRPLNYSYFTGENHDFVEAEVLLPAWSKLFYNTDSKVTIEDLQKTGLDKMIGYRMPTEKKCMFFVFKVVGFLDESQGSTIIVPKEIVKVMGSDFDIDTIYTMNHHFKLNKEGKPEKIQFADNNTDVKDRYINFIVSESDKTLKRKVFTDFKEINKIESDRLYNTIKDELKIQGEYNKEIMINLMNRIKNYFKARNLIILYGLSEELSKTIGENISSLAHNSDDYLYAKLKHIYEYLEIEIELLDTKLYVEDNAKERLIIGRDKQILRGLYNAISETFNEISENKEAEDIEYKKIPDILSENSKEIKLESIKKLAQLNDFISFENFKNISIEEQNTEEALDNQIVDQYMNLLTDPDNIEESITPSGFDDMVESKDMILKLLNNNNNNIINYSLPISQLEYRKRNVNGKSLKAISTNRDTWISMAKLMNISTTLNIKIKVENPKNVIKNHPELAPYYSNIEYPTIDNSTIPYDDKTDTYTLNKFTHRYNILGKLINAYAAQTTSNAYDNVEHPLAPNIEKGFGVFRTLIELGAPMNIGNLLIHQPIVTKLLNITEENNYYYSNTRKTGYTKLYNELLSKLIILYYPEYKKGNKIIFTDNVFKTYESYLKRELTTTEKPENRKPFSHYFNEETIGRIFEKLKNKYKNQFGLLNESDLISTLNGNNSESVEGIISQLNSLNMYYKLESISNDINLFLSKYSQDRKGLTKSLSDHINVYDEKALFTPTLNIAPNHVYTDNNSKNAVLHAFNKYANENAYNTLASEFLDGNRHIKAFKEAYGFKTEKLTNDIIANILHQNSILGSTDYRKLLNIANQYRRIDITDVNNLKAFTELSVVEQLLLLQELYGNEIPSSHLLNKLVHISNKEYIDEVGYPGIGFDSDNNIDAYTDDFRSMFYNYGNPFLHIFATNLIKYTFFHNGLSYGRNLSKVIPPEILYTDPIVERKVKGISLLRGLGLSTTYYKAKNEHYSNDFINPYNVKYAINFARRNYKDDTIVPIVKIPKKTIKRNKHTPNWKPNEDGIIVINQTQFSSVPKKIIEAPVVKMVTWHTRKIGEVTKSYTDIKLYARFVYSYNKLDKNNEETTEYLHFYIPVNKLSKFEFSDVSVVPNNNTVLPKIEYYFNSILKYIKTNNIPITSSLETGYEVSELDTKVQDLGTAVLSSTMGEYYGRDLLDKISENLTENGFYIPDSNDNIVKLVSYNADQSSRTVESLDSNGQPIYKQNIEKEVEYFTVVDNYPTRLPEIYKDNSKVFTMTNSKGLPINVKGRRVLISHYFTKSYGSITGDLQYDVDRKVIQRLEELRLEEESKRNKMAENAMDIYYRNNSYFLIKMAGVIKTVNTDSDVKDIFELADDKISNETQTFTKEEKIINSLKLTAKLTGSSKTEFNINPLNFIEVENEYNKLINNLKCK